MTDEAKALVERLKDEKRAWSFRNTAIDRIDAICLIETQAREIERLREALEDIKKAAFYYTLPKPALDIIHKRARAALAGDSHDQ